MNPDEAQTQLDELEPKVERLKSLYQQYFMGIEKIPPAILRKDVDRTIWRLRRLRFQNTRMRFKFQQIAQRYNTYRQYWGRILRQIEKGTYRRDMLRAAKLVGKEAVVATGGREAERVLRNVEVEEPAERAPAQRVWELPEHVEPATAAESVQDESSWENVLDALGESAPAPASTQGATPAPRASSNAGAATPKPASLTPPASDNALVDPAAWFSGAPSTPPPAPVAPAAPSPASNAQPRPPLPRAGHREPPPPPSAGIAARPPAGAIPPPPSTGIAARPPARPVPPPPSAGIAARPPARPVPPPPAPRARPPAGAIPPPPPPQARPAARPSVEDGRTREIFDNYLSARRAAGESTANLTYEKVATSLKSQAERLRKKHGGHRKVDYEVITENGRAMIRPVVK